MGLLTAMREDAYPAGVSPLADTTAFSLSIAGTMAWAAQLAYEVDDQAKTGQILDRWGWENAMPFSGRFPSHLPLASTKGFTALAGDDLVISFAGTEPNSLLNWITDFSINKTPEGITRGFLAGFEAVKATIAARITQTSGGVWLTGHSLGGAICAAAARDLIEQAILPVNRLRGIYTIGMPRPGDARYAEAYNAVGGDGMLGKLTYRLVYGDDIVPKVPPLSPPFNFVPVGVALHCESGGVFTGTPAAEEIQPDPRLIDELAQAVRGRLDPETRLPPFPAAHAFIGCLLSLLPRAIRDHLPDRYLAALQVLTPG